MQNLELVKVIADRNLLLVKGAVPGNKGGLLKILASSAAGSTYDEIEVEHEGGDLLIAFNNRFLIDSVRACECDRVRIALSSAISSVNIEPAEGGSESCEDLFMILPVRMKE